MKKKTDIKCAQFQVEAQCQQKIQQIRLTFDKLLKFISNPAMWGMGFILHSSFHELKRTTTLLKQFK
jgi:hypothetical protein